MGVVIGECGSDPQRARATLARDEMKINHQAGLSIQGSRAANCDVHLAGHPSTGGKHWRWPRSTACEHGMFRRTRTSRPTKMQGTSFPATRRIERHQAKEKEEWGPRGVVAVNQKGAYGSE